MNQLKFLSLISLLVLSSSYISESTQYTQLRVTKNIAFTYGEELKYRVHYGWINAADISVTVDAKPTMIKGRPTFKVSAFGKTYKSFDWAFKVRDNFVSYIDSQSVAPLKYWKKVQEDNYKDEDLVYYDHEKKWLTGKKKEYGDASLLTRYCKWYFLRTYY